MWRLMSDGPGLATRRLGGVRCSLPTPSRTPAKWPPDMGTECKKFPPPVATPSYPIVSRPGRVGAGLPAGGGGGGGGGGGDGDGVNFF